MKEILLYFCGSFTIAALITAGILTWRLRSYEAKVAAQKVHFDFWYEQCMQTCAEWKQAILDGDEERASSLAEAYRVNHTRFTEEYQKMLNL